MMTETTTPDAGAEAHGKTLPQKLSRFLGDAAFSQERRIATTSVAVLGALLLVTYWLGVARLVPAGALPFLALSAWAVSLCAGVLWHFRGYHGDFTCMTGMMIGMTAGMVPGFIVGALVGALNGIFPGTVVGMLVGMVAGSWAGKCCGVMGLMEGMMAGLMSGTMGAMMALMLLNQFFLPFLILLNACSTLILVGLSYAMYREAGPLPKRSLSPLRFSGAAILAFALLAAFLVWGPRVGVVWVL